MDTLLEELADVRDYALWLVLLVGLVAWLVVVRTLPAAILGTVGAAVGAAVGIPLGHAMFPTVWLAAIAVTAAAGAAIGALLGADIGARRRETGHLPTLSAWVVAWGTACGIVFSYGTGYVVAFARDRPPDFDLVSFSAGLAGGATGWLLGTMIGRTRRHRETSARGELPALIVLIFSAVAMGLALVGGIRAASFGPMIDDAGRRDPRLVPVEIAAWAGTVITAGTFVALAFRTTSRRETRTGADR